jgi:plasmid stabilization system protein ParE
MSVYALTPLAKADIFDIWCHIADDSEDAADRVEQALGHKSIASTAMYTVPTDESAGKAVPRPRSRS